MSSGLIRFWYQDNHPFRYLFYPMHLLLGLMVKFRIWLYQYGWLSSYKIKVPVIIVGNITVGGTGKSPLVIHLAEQLAKAGFNIGILSRGYYGKTTDYPVEVSSTSSPLIVGDEPLMIKQSTDVTVVVDQKRARGARYLQEKCGCNLIICDDGLQHYQLQRDIEILVVDGKRRFGNGLLMPFGPLREPVSRARQVDAVVINQKTKLPVTTTSNFSMVLESTGFVALNNDNRVMEIEDFLNHCMEDGSKIHGIAGIGNPQRFFDQLQTLGFNSTNHPFNDHHSYTVNDFKSIHGIIIMTEKDAVKCRSFATDNMWYLKVTAQLTPSLSQYCLDVIKEDKRDN